MQNKYWYTVAELAIELEMAEQNIRWMIRRYAVKVLYDAGRVLIPLAELSKFRRRIKQKRRR